MAMSSGLGSTARKVTGARRVRLDVLRDSTESKENNDLHPVPSSSTSTRPLADVIPVPQRSVTAQGRQVLPVPNRALAGRLKRSELLAGLEDGEYSHFAARYVGTGTGGGSSLGVGVRS